MTSLPQTRILWHDWATPEQLAEYAQQRREAYEARLALDWCRAHGSPHLQGGEAPPP